ncbi:ABC transporter ATP-binding protein [Fretibacter rubidus]|uniref:ABC transporter ATP-binding protein n=1 Tax=Fretibacter rubidus TaxID=570162 RepID=UPI00352B255E
MIARLWRDFIWPQKHTLLAAAFFMILLALATAAYGFLVKFIIDSAVALQAEADAASNAKRYALLIAPALIVVTMVSGGAMFAQRVLTNKLALNVIAALQKQMFARAHAADYASFAREPVGNLVSKFTNDVSVLSNALIRAVSNLVRDSLTVLFIIISMLVINWQLTVLIVLIYPLAMWPIVTITKRLRGNATDVQSHIGVITSNLQESFGGARMVKTYGLEAAEQKRLGKAFDKRINYYLKLITEQARVDPILEVFGGLAIAGVFIFGVYQYSAGQATPGDIGGVLTLLLTAAPRIRALGTLNNVVQEGLSALARIFTVIDERPLIVDKADAQTLSNPRGAISFEDVSFAYTDGTMAIQEVSFSVKPGQTIALVGASGGGKTTVMNLIPRLYDVSAGKVKIDGIDVRDTTTDSLRGAMALVSQGVTLFNDTVAANIGFGDQNASQDDIITAAKAADAHDFIVSLPDGYNTIIGEDGGSLSGGQRQRIAIARAFLRDAPILLLDEATSALDTQSESKVQAALDRLAKGPTTIVIAHRLSTIKNADCIYVMDGGKIIESGTHAQLSKKRGGAYAKLLKAQALG